MGGVGNWEYKTTDFSGYATVSSDEVPALISRAEEDFRASPAYPDGGPRRLSVVRVKRRPDGKTLIAFSIDGVSDTFAIYVFDPQGKIVERYLRSFWG
jgi:hypothetical protein